MIKKYQRTQQLFDYTTMSGSTQAYLTDLGLEVSDVQWKVSDYIPCNGTEFTLNAIGGGSPAICFYDANKDFIYGQKYNTGTAAVKQAITATMTQTAKYIRFSYYAGSNQSAYVDTSTLMLNEGITALPFEPYGNSWNEVGYKKYGTETETFTTLPKTIIGDGQPISSWSMKGNMTQSGTPTPSNPVYPTEVGDKTANLFEGTLEQGGLNGGDGSEYGSDYRVRSSALPLAAGTYTISVSSSNIIGVFIYNGTTFEQFITYAASPVTFTIGNARNIRFGFSTQSGTIPIAPSSINEVMLNTGSTAKPYEPSGYKIPILSNGNTYPIYLSEPIRNKGTAVDSMASTGTVTRQIRKYVLTGEETVEVLSGQGPIRISGIYFRRPAYADCTWVCSHYEGVPNSASWSNYDYCMTISTQDSDSQIRIRDIDRNSGTAADFKAFLAAQYAAGTPVTIWIYAQDRTETFTAPSIPTSGTAQSFDVDTTLKPSEVSLTWHGWHEHSDTKFTT